MVLTNASPEAKAEFRQRCTCILCGSKALKTVWESSFSDEPSRSEISQNGYAGSPLSALQDQTFRRVRCQDCKMAFYQDVLTDDWLKILYSQWISPAQVAHLEVSLGTSSLETAKHNIKHCLRLHQILKAAPNQPLRLLDFGCGDGDFLRTANLFGFQSAGIDFSDSREKRSQKMGKIARYSTLADFKENSPLSGQLDVITLFQVLEHLVDPLEALESLIPHLKSGGVLIVEVPDCRGVDSSPQDSEAYRNVHPLEHINHFTPDSLTLMAQFAGFEPIVPGAVWVGNRLREVVKAVVGSAIAHSPLKGLRKSTNQYFRKTG